ncbi:MAG: AbrB/MazE/SpoVT family DNA-binding domain-containing protein [Verrucomicrobiae bacterium]|nr:AbrB/MazE/SpoVT family DNA-binding domain-containing protein [Verrucomicrobiae bacterium]
MIATATLTSKGQVTLPKSVRETLGLKQGDILHFESTAPGIFTLKVANRSPQLEGLLHQHLPKNFTPPTHEEIKVAIAEEATRGRFAP